MTSPVTTRFVLQREPDAGFEDWVAETVLHPIGLQFHAGLRYPSYSLNTPFEYVGDQGQTPFDLHALTLIWVIGHKFAPVNNNVTWENNLVRGVFTNTQGLEFLADSYTAKDWIANRLRPSFQQMYPNRPF